MEVRTLTFGQSLNREIVAKRFHVNNMSTFLMVASAKSKKRKCTVLYARRQ